MSAATPAYGLTIKKGSGSIIAQITNLDGPSVERDMLDVTNLSSANGAKEFIGGLIDSGELTLSVNYCPQDSTQKQLLSDLSSNAAATAYTITLTDAGASTISASFIVKSFKLTGAVGDKLSAEFVLKGTGPVTFPV
jgi:predicted secreted protein